MGKREVKESPIERGINETYPFKYPLTDKVPSGTYANPSTTLYDTTDNSDVTSSAMTGTDTIAAGVFTTKTFVADQLVAKRRYRLYHSFTIDGETWDFELFIDARD